MKAIFFYGLLGIVSIISLGLLFLTNLGILDFDPPYARRLSEQLGTQKEVVAFTNVQVIPMDKERILEDQNVVVRSGIIETLGPSDDIEIPMDAMIIDGNEKYLLPGLIDMHVHVLNENELLLFAAHGVTSVRNLWGDMNGTDHLGWRAQIEAGEVFGPFLYTAGPIMEGPPKTMPLMDVYPDPESAIVAVDDQVKQDFDFIKVYDYLDRPTYEAIVTTAQAHGIPVVGHVPKQVGLETVLTSGQLTIEHLSGFIDSDTTEYLVPEDELVAYAKLTANAGVYICPTIGVYQMHVPSAELHQLETRPEMAYIHPGMKALWKYFSRPGAMNNIEYEGNYPAKINKIFIHTTQVLYNNGVKFILGTDSDNPYLVPGASLWDELDYLQQAGFSPYEALETGTRNAAEALGKSEVVGTISPGKRADFILLESNPLENLSAIRSQSGVMLNGLWLPSDQSQSILDELVASFRPAWYERILPVGLIGLVIFGLLRRMRRVNGDHHA